MWLRRLKRFYLRGAIVGCCAVLCAYQWYDTLEQARTDRAQTELSTYKQNGNLAEAIEEHVLHVIKGADALATLIAADFARPGARIDLKKYADAGYMDRAALHNIYIANASGDVVLSLNGSQHGNLMDREHFQVHAASDTGRLYVGQPLIGRSSGLWTLHMTRRITLPDGRFGGIVSMAMNPAYFADFFRLADLGGEGMVNLVGLDGISRVRTAGARVSYGGNMSGNRLMAELAQHRDGEFLSSGQYEGIPRYVSYRTLPDYPLALALGQSEHDVLAEAHRRRREEFFHTILFTVVVSGIAIMLVMTLARRERDAHALAQSEAQMRAVFDQAAMGITRTALDGRIEEANPRFCELLGYSREELRRLTWQQLTHPEDLQGSLEFERSQFTLPNASGLEKRYLHKNGHSVWVSVSASLMRDRQGNPAFYVNMIEGISERKQMEQELQHQAQHDNLTGLPNRAVLQDRLAHAVSQASRRNWTTGVMFIDLDHFKEVNDTLGHAAGDELLRHVATQLRQCVRGDDTVARLGGDEFAIVLYELQRAEDAGITAQKILDALERPLQIAGHEVHVSASIGIATSPPEDHDADILLRKADAAMYEAKQAGRNAYRFHTAGSNERAVMKNAQLKELRRALAQQEFVLHYQPKVSLREGRITGMEALLRWQRPDGVLVPPAEFIPLLEESGLIVPVGEWVVRAVCAHISEWERDGLPPVAIAINLSARQFQEHKLCAMVEDALRDFKVDPGHLAIEITESAAMHNPDQTADTLRRLKALGLRIAIDDFGTGYSSLSYLQRFPIDTIKIDRAFVTELPGNGSDASIAQAVIGLAHALHLQVVAEGVETSAQRDFLAGHACDEVQGYFFSPPLPADRCKALLRQGLTWPQEPSAS